MFRPYLKRSLTCLVRCRVGSTLPYGGIQTKVCGDQNSVSRRPHGRKKRRGVKCELGQFIQGFASQARNYLIVLPCHIPVKKMKKKCQFVRVIQFIQSRRHNNFYRNKCTGAQGNSFLPVTQIPG